MGSFKGHVVPGSLFLVIGVWHMWSSVVRYVSSSSSSFRVRAWNPVPGLDGKLKHLELYVVALGALVDLCIELLYSTHLKFLVNGVLNPSHMNNFEHSGMLLMFFIFGVVALLSQKTSIAFSAPTMPNDTGKGKVSGDVSMAASDLGNQKKRKRMSLVWIDFDFDLLYDGELSIGRCKHCSKQIPAPSHNGTSNLRKHLAGSCPVYKLQADNIQQSTLTFDGSKKDGFIGSHIFKLNYEVSRELLAKMIILHEYPFNMVNHIGFKKLLSSLKPSFQPKSRNTVRDDCMKRYEKEKKILYKQLDNLQCRISLTSDMWTSNQNKGYMSLTTHFIDEEWKLRKRILCFSTLDKYHTGEKIANDLLKKMYECNIDRKLGSITLDNCTTNDAVVRELLHKFKHKGVILSKGRMFQVRCTAHILNLVVQDGLTAIQNVIEKVRASVKFIT